MKRTAFLLFSFSGFIALGLFLGSAVSAPAEQADKLTLAGLVREMTDMEALSKMERSGTRLIQFSSYDRGSKVVDGRTVNWWANVDLGNYLREEKTPRGEEWVMAEVQGPGALVRIWSANPGGSIWGTRIYRVYIDGSEEPVIEERGQDLLGGKVKPWTEPFAGFRAMGGNFIFPIPFSRSLKVTAANPSGKGKPLMYYQVDVRTYPPGTEVESFSRQALQQCDKEIKRAAAILENPALLDEEIKARGGRSEAELELAPSAEGELFSFRGPAAVAFLEFELPCKEPEKTAELLGKTLLVMTWDDEKRPAVQVPLGDFFGASPAAPRLVSLPAQIIPGEKSVTLTSRWFMPFRESALVLVKNFSQTRLKLRAAAVAVPYSWSEESLYFHAGFREAVNRKTRPFWDMTMLEAEGRGHFVGLEMNVRNPMEFFWWGEGDEKIWVDDDEFPSIFGTGTEDYFGYAWCFQYLHFNHAFHGIGVPTREWLVVAQMTPIPFFWEAVSNATSRKAVVSQYRWHILDRIPFYRKIRFDMEIWHHRNTTLDINATSFWYAEPGAKDDCSSPDLSAREVWKP